jgi:LSD1 subclass zinc finger protein
MLTENQVADVIVIAPRTAPEPREAVLAYCGLCRELYEYEPGPERYPEIRCPLCGFRHGEV